MRRPWESYFSMVLLGLACGVLLGFPPGFPLLGLEPVYAREVSTLAIVLAMTFSLTEVRFRGLSAREEVRPTARAVLLNYGLLTAAILALSLAYPDEAIRNGWIVIASAPSAIAVIPITSVFRGNARRALVSTATIYVLALLALPAITLAFAGQAADAAEVATQILLLVGLPLLLSRAVLAVEAIARHRTVLVNVSFFVLVFSITGANRHVFFEDVALVGALMAGAFVRTWGIGAVLLAASRRLGRDRAGQVADVLFGSLKNLGISALFAFSLFGATAALPAIVCLFFEVSWILAIARRFGR